LEATFAELNSEAKVPGKKSQYHFVGKIVKSMLILPSRHFSASLPPLSTQARKNDEKQNIPHLTLSELEQYFESLKEQKFRGRQVFEWSGLLSS
jgi:hypothetical protein